MFEGWLGVVGFLAAAGIGGYLIGSWRSPAAKAARDEAKVWRGRYHQQIQETQALEGQLGKAAPLGSVTGLEGLAQMFLGGEEFSLGKLLGALKENPELIGQIWQLWKTGVKPAAPAAGPPGTATSAPAAGPVPRKILGG